MANHFTQGIIKTELKYLCETSFNQYFARQENHKKKNWKKKKKFKSFSTRTEAIDLILNKNMKFKVESQ